MRTTLLLLLFATSAGCATVSASERERLADPVMMPELQEDSERMRQDVQEVREASRGGLTLEGAGCGCN